MAFVTRVIRNNPVLSYVGLTFAISWGGVLLVTGGSAPTPGSPATRDPRFVYALVAMLAGPCISGVLLTAVVHGRKGLREYLRRAGRWRGSGRWFVVALFTAPVLWIATLAALSLFSRQFLPAIVTTDERPGLVLMGLAVALAAGLLEELGWTGFAIVSLRRHHGVLATGLLVGVLWGAWHVLTNVVWASGAIAGDLPLAVFVPASSLGLLTGYLVAYRVLMVWVFDHTQSTLIAVAMHASLTASVLILDPAGLVGGVLLLYSLALAGTVWAAVAVVAAWNGWLARGTPGSAQSPRLAT